MRTRVGQPYSEQVVEEDIRNLYATGNVVNVRIYGEPLGETGVRVIVVLQAKAKVTSVELEGVKEFKASRIRDKISTKPGDAANEASLEADRQAILEYYRSKGFTDVDVTYKLDTNERLGTARVKFEVRSAVCWQLPTHIQRIVQGGEDSKVSHVTEPDS
jgi:outer membrane protein insertion porin family